MRRYIALLLTLATVLSAAPLTQAQNDVFWDVRGTRYADAFSTLGARGVVSGYADESGRPGNAIARAEAVAIIVRARAALRTRAEGFARNMPPVPLFYDIDQTAWYAPSVEAAFEAHLLSGYPDRTFRPAWPVTAEEGIALVMRAYGRSGVQAPGDEWFRAPVQSAYALKVVDDAETLRLGGLLTRGQFLDMVYRMDAIDAGKLTTFDPRRVRTEQGSSSSPSVAPTQEFAIPVITLPVVSSASSSTPQVQPRVAEGTPGNVPLSSKPFAITIPSLGIEDLTVTHPEDATTSKGLLSVLVNGVGHLFSYPGGGGKIMIYGHSSGYPWDVSKFTKIFRTINKLHEGELIYLTFDGKMHVYQVSFKETIDAKDMRSFSGEGEELILYTCWPPDSIKQRYLVHALPVSAVALR